MPERVHGNVTGPDRRSMGAQRYGERVVTYVATTSIGNLHLLSNVVVLLKQKVKKMQLNFVRLGLLAISKILG